MSVHALDLEVCGLGMVTSVGHDAATACAAIRAGISRPGPIHECMTSNLSEPGSRPLTGHPVVPLTNGFASVARWQQMSRIALADLLAQIDGGNVATCLYLLLPELDESRFEYDDHGDLDAIQRILVGPLLSRWRPHALELRPRGRVGLAEVLAEAQLALNSGIDRVIVLAVDSYVDAHALTWLEMSEALAHDRNPVGLMPGEAAVALGLERPRRAAAARITLAGDAPHDTESDSGGQKLGRLLAQLYGPEVAELYTDLNGEEWRAHAHALALMELPGQGAGIEVHHVAAEIGDTGEVSALLNLGLAARSMVLGYARGGAALVAAQTANASLAVRIGRA